METTTETNPNWLYMQEVTAKLRQTEKQAETIKDTTLHSNRFRLARLLPVSPTRHKIH